MAFRLAVDCSSARALFLPFFFLPRYQPRPTRLPSSPENWFLGDNNSFTSLNHFGLCTQKRDTMFGPTTKNG